MVGARFVVNHTVKSTQFATPIARCLSVYVFYEHVMYRSASVNDVVGVLGFLRLVFQLACKY